MGGVYCLECLINNKKYIGSCLDFTKRKSIHFNHLKNNKANKLLQEDYNKYGVENFSFYIIEEIRNTELFCERENYWMDYYKTYIPKYGIEFGYNSRKAYIPSNETRDKMAKSKLGKKMENFNVDRNNTKNPNSVLSLDDCFKIKQLIMESNKERVDVIVERIANIFNVSRTQIGRIRDGRHWSSPQLGGNFKEW